LAGRGSEKNPVPLHQTKYSWLGEEVRKIPFLFTKPNIVGWERE
jgi:hypothetical protein